MANLVITDIDARQLANDLYLYFKDEKDSFDFEKFLKPVLESYGLDQIIVTKRSKDGGVDLTGIRAGLGGFGEADETKYYVQAKRYENGNNVAVGAIRELKGVIPTGCKGIFITTSDFTKEAKKEAANGVTAPIVLIDGISLIEQCIKAEIGIKFKAVLNKEGLNDILIEEKVVSDEKAGGIKESEAETEKLISTKLITENDIKRRIISLPSDVSKKVPASAKSIKVILGQGDPVVCTYTQSRKMISGITQFLRDNKLLDLNDKMYPKQANWYYDETSKEFRIEIENSAR